MAKAKKEEVKLEEEMANIYDEKTREMSLDSTDFIKMNESHSALSRDNDTDKKIDTQISDIYKKRNKLLIVIIVILVLAIGVLAYGGYRLYSENDRLNKQVKKLEDEVSALNKEIGEKESKEEPIIYKQVFVGDGLLKNYNLSKYIESTTTINSSKEDLTTEVLLNNLNSMVYNYNPNKVFISVGLNDLINKEEKDKIISNIKEIIRKIKENNSNTKIYILSLVPLNYDDIDSIKSVNEELDKLSNSTYVDIYSILKEVNGDVISSLYSEGKKVLNDKGYEVITDYLNKYLEEK